LRLLFMVSSKTSQSRVLKKIHPNLSMVDLLIRVVAIVNEAVLEIFLLPDWSVDLPGHESHLDLAVDLPDIFFNPNTVLIVAGSLVLSINSVMTHMSGILAMACSRLGKSFFLEAGSAGRRSCLRKCRIRSCLLHSLGFEGCRVWRGFSFFPHLSLPIGRPGVQGLFKSLQSGHVALNIHFH